jgi:hypothetical protein
MKCELDLYEYVLVYTITYFSPQVHTKYVQFFLSMCVVPTGMYCVYKNITGDAVLCCMTVGNNTVCVRDMYAVVLKSVPLLVFNIHDNILVRTWYILVCTGLYYYTFSVPERTSTYWYVPVHTKNPVPVQRFTIPDADLSYVTRTSLY